MLTPLRSLVFIWPVLHVRMARSIRETLGSRDRTRPLTNSTQMVAVDTAMR